MDCRLTIGTDPLNNIQLCGFTYCCCYLVVIARDFPCGSAGKESTCNVGDLGLIPGLGISPGEGEGYQLQYSGLENPMDTGPGGLQSMGSQRVSHD